MIEHLRADGILPPKIDCHIFDILIVVLTCFYFRLLFVIMMYYVCFLITILSYYFTTTSLKLTILNKNYYKLL